MKLLLDTHIFLWYISGDPQLSAAWRSVLDAPANMVYLSVVSIWEASIKYHLGKLPLPAPPEMYLPQQRRKHSIAALPLNENDIAALGTLPALHRDPFDRALICQALANGLTLVTVDAAVHAYPVALLPEF